MCIAICLGKRASITKEQFMNSWSNNPDGFGMLYASDGVLYSYKNLDNKEEAYAQYMKTHEEFGEYTDMVLHFRIGTSGKKNLDNCHPFFVNEHLAFVHNGVLDIDLKDKRYSDTWHFNEELKSMPEKFLDNSFFCELLSAYIGHSKLVFLGSDGNSVIINHNLGDFSKDKTAWYSNGTHAYSYKKYDYGSKNEPRYYEYCWECGKKLEVGNLSTLCYSCSKVAGKDVPEKKETKYLDDEHSCKTCTAENCNGCVVMEKYLKQFEAAPPVTA